MDSDAFPGLGRTWVMMCHVSLVMVTDFDFAGGWGQGSRKRLVAMGRDAYVWGCINGWLWRDRASVCGSEGVAASGIHSERIRATWHYGHISLLRLCANGMFLCLTSLCCICVSSSNARDWYFYFIDLLHIVPHAFVTVGNCQINDRLWMSEDKSPLCMEMHVRLLLNWVLANCMRYEGTGHFRIDTPGDNFIQQLSFVLLAVVEGRWRKRTCRGARLRNGNVLDMGSLQVGTTLVEQFTNWHF